MRLGTLAALMLPILARADNPKPLHIFQHDGIVRPAAFSPDGKLLATGSYDRKVRLWDVSSGTMRRSLDVSNALLALAFSPNGKKLAAGTHQGELSVFQTETGRKLVAIKTGRGNISGLSWSPDGKTIATADYESSISLWDAATGKNEKQLAGHTTRIWSVAFSPDGSLLASAGEDAVIRLWDPGSGREVRKLMGHGSSVGCVSFSRDGRLLVSAAADGTFRVWELLSGVEVMQIRGLAPHTAVFSADGRFIAGATRDNSVRVWDSATGKEVTAFEGHLAWALGVAFSPDGKHLVTTSQDKTARLWALDGLLPPLIPAPLTNTERDRHWAALAATDVVKAYQGIHALANDPASAGMLEKHLKSASMVTPEERKKLRERLPALVRDLDAADASIADRAMAELEKIGEPALPFLRVAHRKASSIEMLARTAVLIDNTEKRQTSPEHFRALRALAVLERLGGERAKALLQKLAAGDGDALLTAEAKASLARLP